MARIVQLSILATLVTSLLAWRAKSTHDNVIVGVTDDITLRCDDVREDNSESNSTIGQITRIRLLKVENRGGSKWKGIAEIIVPDISRVRWLEKEEADFSGVVTSGFLGRPTNSFLSVTWLTATESTVGTYRCEVDGFVTEEWSDFHQSTNSANITNVVPSTMDLVGVINEMKAKSEKMAEKLANLTSKHDAEAVSLKHEMASVNEKQTQDIMNDVKRIVEFDLIEARIWPSGNYSLLATSDGCPRATPYNQFRNGFIKVRADPSTIPEHNTSAMNHLSQPFIESCNLSNIVTFRYCNHITSAMPITVNWPMGSYCIRENSGSNCPERFERAEADFYLKTSSQLTISTEHNPRYTYWPSIKQLDFFFCCRDDGHPSYAIPLPTSTPFYLYRYKGVCQSVLNMDVINEWIELDTDDSNKDNFDTDIYPDISLNDFKVELCYYTKKAF